MAERSAYDRSPCAPLVSDAAKERIAAKAARSTLPQQFINAMIEEEERVPRPLAPEPAYRR